MKVRENFNIIIEKHPYADTLNKKLLKELEEHDYPLAYKTNVQAKMTNIFISSPNTNRIIELVNSLIINSYGSNFSSLTRDFNLDWEDIWFAKYDLGDYTKPHDHLFNGQFSFVYFVKCPRGSAPLIFTTSGKKVKAEEGKIVIFPTSLIHHVPVNRVEGRVVIAGNGILFPKG